MSNRTRITPAIVAASTPAVVLPDSRPAGDTASPGVSPFRAMLAASAAKTATTSRRAGVASKFPSADAPEFPSAVLAACEAVLAGQSEPDASEAFKLVAERLNKLGVRPCSKYDTGAKYNNRSALAGVALWQRDGIAKVVADATREETPAE